MKATSQGFSLIELVIAAGIMAFIIAMVVPAYNTYRKRANISATQTILKTTETAIDMYQNDTGAYPATLSDLFNKPADPKLAKRWQGPYVSKPVENDAFGRELVYQVTKGGKHPYELYSWGPNREDSPEEEHINVWDL